MIVIVVGFRVSILNSQSTDDAEEEGHGAWFNESVHGDAGSERAEFVGAPCQLLNLIRHDIVM